MKSLYLFLLILCTPLTTSAIDIGDGVIFQTPDTNITFHIANGFICTNIAVYTNMLYINNGNITATNTTHHTNISLENLNINPQQIDFTSNASIDSLSITNGFMGFSITDGRCYDLDTSVGVLYQNDTALDGSVLFTSIVEGSYYISASLTETVINAVDILNINAKSAFVLAAIFVFLIVAIALLTALFTISSGESLPKNFFTNAVIGLIVIIAVLYIGIKIISCISIVAG